MRTLLSLFVSVCFLAVFFAVESVIFVFVQLKALLYSGVNVRASLSLWKVQLAIINVVHSDRQYV